ncbi:MAG: 3'-5' exonuclease [Anaerolineales bacterium]
MPDRKSAIQTARRILLRAPLYLDTETTGIDQKSEIVEICIIDNKGKVIFDSLIKPTKAIPYDAISIHGITDDMVIDAPRWFELWPEIRSLLSRKTVCIYNADYDVRLIKQTNLIYKIPFQISPETQFRCIMKLYAQFYGQWNPTRRSYRWFSLEAAGKHLGIPLSNTHRARDDTLLAKSVLEKIATSETH